MGTAHHTDGMNIGYVYRSVPGTFPFRVGTFRGELYRGVGTGSVRYDFPCKLAKQRSRASLGGLALFDTSRPDDNCYDYEPGEEPWPSTCSLIDDPVNETDRDPE